MKKTLVGSDAAGNCGVALFLRCTGSPNLHNSFASASRLICRQAISILLVFTASVLCSSPASAQLSQLTMEDMRLLYFESTEGYLAPHVARCFLNSMEFQRKIWGWEPS